jgi:hypothetical protein
MESKYPLRDCTIMDTYLIDNGWKLEPYMDNNRKDISRWAFSTMGLIARTYRKGDETICIGIMMAGIPPHVWFKRRYYYMPVDNPAQFLEDAKQGKVRSIIEIRHEIYINELREKNPGKTIFVE